MKKTLFLLCVLLFLSSTARDPENVLIKYDTDYGGPSVVYAVEDLWPACYYEAYDGNTWGPFNEALRGGGWDVVVVANDRYPCSSPVPFENLLDWYLENDRLFFYDYWTTVDDYHDLVSTMGAPYYEGPFSSLDQYAWNPEHPICEGVDFTGTYPGIRFWWATADPVTGWAPEESQARGAIMVAENGIGVVSGFNPGYIGGGQGVELWENILAFMWESDAVVVPTSWGAVKALY
jgi:hypothetical protein